MSRRRRVEFDAKDGAVGLNIAVWAHSDDDAVRVVNDVLRPKPPAPGPVKPVKGVNKRKPEPPPKPVNSTLQFEDWEDMLDSMPDGLCAYNTAFVYLNEFRALTKADILIGYEESEDENEGDEDDEDDEEDGEDDEEDTSDKPIFNQ
jgi:hypothetical protein